MLKCNFKSITKTKLGNTIDENEDNLLMPSNANEALLRFAISDGATESSFSKEWSNLLVSYYKDSSFEQAHFVSTLNEASKLWQSRTNTVELPWYAQQKAEIGAFAAFLGLTIDRENFTFNSVAIGDCNLFHVRNNNLEASFPILKANDFGNTPPLLSSNIKYQKDIEKQLRYYNEKVSPNDTIMLATDAIAAWILTKTENECKPWNELQCLLSFEDYETDFQNWLNNKRRESEIKNDDVTLIIINFQ